MHSFFFCKLQLITDLLFNSRFLYELKREFDLYKTVFGIFHFRFRQVFIKVYTVFSPINGHSKRRTPLISGQFVFSPAKLWSMSHKKLSKRRTGN